MTAGRRAMPEDIRRALLSAERLIALARGVEQRRRSLDAAGRLYRALVRRGWRASEIARVVGMSGSAIRRRLSEADPVPPATDDGLDVPGPPPPPLDNWGRRRALLARPPEDRDLLTRGDAARLLDMRESTISSWHRKGLLPHTDDSVIAAYLYSRRDLETVRDSKPADHKRRISISEARRAVTGAPKERV